MDKRTKRSGIAAAVLLGLKIAEWLLSWLGNMDLVVSRIKEPGWIGTTVNFLLLDPPNWFSNLLLVTALGLLIYVSFRQRNGSPIFRPVGDEGFILLSQVLRQAYDRDRDKENYPLYFIPQISLMEGHGQHEKVLDRLAEKISKHVDLYGVNNSGTSQIKIGAHYLNFGNSRNYFHGKGSYICRKNDIASPFQESKPDVELWHNIKIKKADVEKAIECMRGYVEVTTQAPDIPSTSMQVFGETGPLAPTGRTYVDDEYDEGSTKAPTDVPPEHTAPVKFEPPSSDAPLTKVLQYEISHFENEIKRITELRAETPSEYQTQNKLLASNRERLKSAQRQLVAINDKSPPTDAQMKVALEAGYKVATLQEEIDGLSSMKPTTIAEAAKKEKVIAKKTRALDDIKESTAPGPTFGVVVNSDFIFEQQIPLTELVDIARSRGWEFEKDLQSLDFVKGIQQAALNGQIRFFGRKYEYSNKGSMINPLERIEKSNWKKYSLDVSTIIQFFLINGFIVGLQSQNAGTAVYDDVLKKNKVFIDIHVGKDSAFNWLRFDSDQYKGATK